MKVSIYIIHVVAKNFILLAVKTVIILFIFSRNVALQISWCASNK